MSLYWVFSASVIVHEWGHLRWGLKDEYPTIIKGASIERSDFYQEDGKWKQAGYTLFLDFSFRCKERPKDRGGGAIQNRNVSLYGSTNLFQ